MRDVRRLLGTVRNKMSEEGRDLVGRLQATYDSDLDTAVPAAERFAEVLKGLRVLRDEERPVVGLLDAHDEVARRRDELLVHLRALATSTEALKHHQDELRSHDFGALRDLLSREADADAGAIDLPLEADPLLEKLLAVADEALPLDDDGDDPAA